MTKTDATGNLLVRIGLIDASGLSQAREVQDLKNVTIGKALATLGLADEEAVSAAIAKELRLELLHSELPAVSSDVAALLPSDFCNKRLIVPLGVEGNTLRLAMTDPLDFSAIQDAEFRAGKRVVAVVASETMIRNLLNQVYSTKEQSQNIFGGAAPQGEVESLREAEFELADPAKLARDTKMTPVIRIVNLILSGAAKMGASDIHLEPKENHLQVRQRVDGLLQDVLLIPRNLQDATISRLKILSGMDITERRRPQDGRSRLKYEGKRIELRISTLPTQFGEKIAIRLLDNRNADFSMERLGLTPEDLKVFEGMLSRPQGMILVTGPTGSGKSSTLYIAVNRVKSTTTNIITVEDPIEYQLDGVNQVQINPKAGVTFAAGLRSILRQDPNVILVGEIRDRETAAIALEAAQTGHLLLSTLHTNDAPGTITRLLDLDIEPFLIASALVGVIAQRLVRRPCPSCAIPQPPSPELIERLGGSSRLPSDGKWLAAKGCPQCGNIGYKGRLAILELLPMNPEVKDLITRRAPEEAIRKAARKAGMRTILEDGILKASQGKTTLEEVLRVVSTDDESRVRDQATLPHSEGVGAAQMEIDELLSPLLSSDNVPGDSGGRERVLLVEDSLTILSVVKYFLELEGFEVLVAKDGVAGLEMARRHKPDVIVSDYSMPGMNGLEMLKALRADPLTQGIAILMLTSEASVEKETQALEVGADDYILKPVEPRRLAARVKAALIRSRERATVSKP
jgi:type IV pilus assembly protein PilB